MFLIHSSSKKRYFQDFLSAIILPFSIFKFFELVKFSFPCENDHEYFSDHFPLIEIVIFLSKLQFAFAVEKYHFPRKIDFSCYTRTGFAFVSENSFLFSSKLWYFQDFSIQLNWSVSFDMRRTKNSSHRNIDIFETFRSNWTCLFLLIATLIFLRFFDTKILIPRWRHSLVSEKKWWTWLLNFEPATNINI